MGQWEASWWSKIRPASKQTQKMVPMQTRGADCSVPARPVPSRRGCCEAPGAQNMPCGEHAHWDGQMPGNPRTNWAYDP